MVHRLGVQDPGIERNKEARNTHSTSERDQVKGARHVWCTVKVTTSAVVKKHHSTALYSWAKCISEKEI